MASNFSQYTIAVLLLLLTTSSVLMVTEASSEACDKNGGGVGDDNCRRLQPQQLSPCRERLDMPAGMQYCEQPWCMNACKLKHFGQEPDGRCYDYYIHPNAYCLCFFKCG